MQVIGNILLPCNIFFSDYKSCFFLDVTQSVGDAPFSFFFSKSRNTSNTSDVDTVIHEIHVIKVIQVIQVIQVMQAMQVIQVM